VNHGLEDPIASAEDAERSKLEARAVWSSGNYDAVAKGILEVGRAVVEAVAVRRGERVVDVACGTGNAAIPAALAGGRVIGVDLVSAMFAAAERRAADAGVEIDWVEGDAEALPFENGSFDVALSTFGLMFAPRQGVAATEMARVVREGGRIGLASWTPEGTVGGLFGVLERHLPATDPSPMLWGREGHVREYFAGSGFDLHFERRALRLNPDIDVEEAAGFYLGSFGPLVRARQRLEPEGRWEAAAAELVPAIESMMRTPPEYLLVTGNKADAGVRRSP
jgi:SAM-dependent methyltransferase